MHWMRLLKSCTPRREGFLLQEQVLVVGSRRVFRLFVHLFVFCATICLHQHLYLLLLGSCALNETIGCYKNTARKGQPTKAQRASKTDSKLLLVTRPT